MALPICDYEHADMLLLTRGYDATRLLLACSDGSFALLDPANGLALARCATASENGTSLPASYAMSSTVIAYPATLENGTSLRGCNCVSGTDVACPATPEKGASLRGTDTACGAICLRACSVLSQLSA
eukprot:2106271-Rhodomonas_salina.1